MATTKTSTLSRTPAALCAATLLCVGAATGCAAEPTPALTVEAVSAATLSLEQTALRVAEGFAEADRGTTERSEAWLPEILQTIEANEGVEVDNGQEPDDGLVLLSHDETDTYKCVAVTGAADSAGEADNIAEVTTGTPRC